jgi:hypothetical protein
MNAADDFAMRRAIALAILSKDQRLTRKAGQFLGQCCVDQNPLSERQAEWLTQLAERAGVAPETKHD